MASGWGSEHRWRRAFLIWTALVAVGGLVFAAYASDALLDAQQMCYFQIAPCPANDGPDVLRLQFAMLGFPAVWLVGVIIGAILAVVRSNRD